MTARSWLAFSLATALLALVLLADSTPACCPAPPRGKPVVNADQTVIIIWDPVSKTEHFIRQASFKSEADDFGFLVPTPTQPELEESGNEAFPALYDLTKPEIKKHPVPKGGGYVPFACGAGTTMPSRGAPPPLRVVEE